MKAILLALLHFQDQLRGQVVMVCSDNATAVAYLNEQGGTRSSQMLALVWRILAWATSHQVVLKGNVMADSLSRQGKVLQSEWFLHPVVFRSLCQTWHTPHVEMFATWQNHKLPVYVSPMPDTRAWQVDARSIPWNNLDGYVYAPVTVIPRVIQKMHAFPCRMIVVAPGWPGMPWFWDLLSLSFRPSLEQAAETTTQPDVSQQPRVPESPRVVAGVQESQSPRFSSSVEGRIRAPQRASSRAIYTSRCSLYGKWCKQNKMHV